MKTFEIIEVVSYEVDAVDEDDAYEIFIEHGPGLPSSPVKFCGVDERVIDEKQPNP